MKEQQQHFQSISITIVAIATAALGFGLFQAYGDAMAAALALENWVGFAAWMKLLSGAAAVFFSVMMLVSVYRILVKHDGLTGEQVVRGPFVYLGMVMLHSIIVFVCSAIIAG